MAFVNEQISLDALPRYQDVSLTAVDPKYKYVIYWNWLLVFVLLCAIAGSFFIASDLYRFRWVAAGIAMLIALSWGILHLQAFKRRAFAVRDHDVIYKHGILSIATTVIPFNRIQHVTVKEGITARWYGLASIQVFTAGGASSDLKINGLPKAVADSLKALILQKIKQ